MMLFLPQFRKEGVYKSRGYSVFVEEMKKNVSLNMSLSRCLFLRRLSDLGHRRLPTDRVQPKQSTIVLDLAGDSLEIEFLPKSDGCRSWLLPTVGLACDDERALVRSHHPCRHVEIAARQPILPGSVILTVILSLSARRQRNERPWGQIRRDHAYR